MGQSHTSSSSVSGAYDFAGGQDAAHKQSMLMADLEGTKLSQLMSDPVAAISSANRIRRIQDYLAAYRGGYQLPDQEVIPRVRLDQANTSSSQSSTHS
jgi:hypothetical protein